MEQVEARSRKLVFPFTAIVGLDKAKLALLCAAVNPLIGGVLLRGDKGTGKSTLVRALANVLPDIEVVAGCPFNCNPHDPLEMCDACHERWARGEELPVSKRRMRVVDLPLSITVDRLVGTLDIERALKEGVRALHPGLLAEANQNILYIDEVNLLDDYVADVLLDCAAMGWNTVEREGVSVRHPSRFILVGSMNPEEGELRPQILDRFGLSVNIEAPMDPEARCEIVKRVEEFHADPLSFYRKYEQAEEELRGRVAKAKKLLRTVEVGEDLLSLLAKTVVELGVKTSRAEVVTVKAAKAIAALEGRTKVTLEDLERAMELALPHRLRAKPFEPQPPELPKLAQQRSSEASSDHEGGHHHHHGHPPSGRTSSMNERGTGSCEKTFEPQRGVKAELPRPTRSLEEGQPRLRGSRDHRLTIVGHPHGHPVSYVPPRGELCDVDLAATIAMASLRGEKPPVKVELSDVRVRVRKARAPTLTVLLLDSSGSMAALRRISLAKGLATSIVEEAYVKRSPVALIVFRGAQAELLVPPTRNYLDLLTALGRVPTGGRTPLSSALHALLALTRRERIKRRDLKVRALLITDGKANVPLSEGGLREELERLAAEVGRSGVELTIYDTRPPSSIDPAPSYVELLSEAARAHVLKP